MNPESNSSLTKVTPLSKALAAILFIVLPFVGLYIGYTFAPEKVGVTGDVGRANSFACITDSNVEKLDCLVAYKSSLESKINNKVVILEEDRYQLIGKKNNFRAEYELAVSAIPEPNYQESVAEYKIWLQSFCENHINLWGGSLRGHAITACEITFFESLLSELD